MVGWQTEGQSEMFALLRGSRAKALVMGFGALLLGRITADAATVLYRTDSELIRAADRIVRGQVVSVRVEEEPGGGIYTITTLSVLEDYSGAPDRLVEIRELGGATPTRFLYVEGAATYEPGSEVLVMLERTRGGRFRSMSMAMSKFDVIPSPDGDPILLRNMDGVAVAPGGGPVTRVLRLSTLRALARLERGVAAVQQPAVVSGAPLQASDSFTLLRFGNGLGVRWTEPDTGVPVRWYRDTSAPSPLATGADGSAEIQTALAAWSTPSQTSLRLTYNGGTNQDPYGPWPALGGSGAGVVFFEDPNDEIAGNVLAIGGGGGTSGDGGTVNGTTFNRFTYGFVIMQNAAALGANFRQSQDFARVLEHEVGHAIGLGHTPTDGSVATPQANIMYPSCCSSQTPVAPALGPDDLAGLTFIYPAAACTYSVTPASVQLPSPGGGFSLSVSTAAGCQWSVQALPSWITGPTGARSGPGTVTLTAAANTAIQDRSATLTVASRAVPVTQSGSHPVSGAQADFNGDGRPDLLWHHQGNGGISVWFMNGTTLIDGQVISQVADTNWSLAGTGDLDGDGQGDFVWRHTDGRVSAWLMNGLALRQGSLLSVPSVADPLWEIRSVGDIDGDAKADLFWHHQGDGRLEVWLMNGLTVRQQVALNPPQVPDTAWQLVATADFDGDGRRDLLWHHSTGGWIAVWRMNGLDQIDGRATSPGQVPDLSWQIRAAVDLNADGHTDIVWQNVVDGRISAWLMRGTTLADGVLLTPSQVGDLQWRIVGPR